MSDEYFIVDRNGNVCEEVTQEIFDSLFITCVDICKELDVTRTTLSLKQGVEKFPQAINCGNVKVMTRRHVTPFIDAWRPSLNKRRRIKA